MQFLLPQLGACRSKEHADCHPAFLPICHQETRGLLCYLQEGSPSQMNFYICIKAYESIKQTKKKQEKFCFTNNLHLCDHTI